MAESENPTIIIDCGMPPEIQKIIFSDFFGSQKDEKSTFCPLRSRVPKSRKSNLENFSQLVEECAVVDSTSL